MRNEEWRPVRGFEGLYEVSSMGRVRSLPRKMIRRDGKSLTVSGGILTARPNGRGYPRLSLYNNGERAWATVHSLVARAFLPEPPGPIGSRRGQFTVNHRNGDKTDNRVANLEYVTATENYRHAKRHGLIVHRGVRNPHAKIGPDEVREIRRLYGYGARQVDLAERFGIDQTNISRVVRRETWAHVR